MSGMNAVRLMAIVMIFIGATISWAILGGTLYTRTEDADAALLGQVADLWGARQRQTSPTITLLDELTEDETKRKVTPRLPQSVIPDASEVRVDLDLDMRRKGLIWYRTYEVAFDALYTVTNPADAPRLLTAKFFLPSTRAIYDDFHFEVAGSEASPNGGDPPMAQQQVQIEPGQTVTIKARYKSRGLDSWAYGFGSNVMEARDFKLVVNTDFARVDFPVASLSPTDEQKSGEGWKLVWQFDHLVSGLDMGVEMPERLQPGPWAARLSFFAPVGLLFYMFVLVVVGVLTGRSLHPMHYFFIAGGFFAFHILLAYTVDLVDMNVAFSLCSVVSVLLVVTYLLRVRGARFALGVAAPAQLFFLVLFSYAFYYPGYTGLAITVASIVTLALMMHMTARVDWGGNAATAAKEADGGD